MTDRIKELEEEVHALTVRAQEAEDRAAGADAIVMRAEGSLRGGEIDVFEKDAPQRRRNFATGFVRMNGQGCGLVGTPAHGNTRKARQHAACDQRARNGKICFHKNPVAPVRLSELNRPQITGAAVPRQRQIASEFNHFAPPRIPLRIRAVD